MKTKTIFGRHARAAALVRCLWVGSIGLGSLATALGQPVITSQPADQFVGVGFNAKFELKASGTAPAIYQWFFKSNALAGGTEALLTLTNAQLGNAGDYFAIVSNLDGAQTSRVAKLTVSPPATLDSKIGPNIRLGEDPPELPAATRNQAEPHLIRSLRDPKILVATFQEGRTNIGALAIGGAISRDGGITWNRSLLPGLTALNGGPFPFASDPVAATDLSGNFFINTLTAEAFSPVWKSKCYLSSSTNSGASFGPPVNLVDIPGLDKNWFTINTYPGSTTVGRMLLTWTQLDKTAMAYENLRSIYSDDGGVTWSASSILTQGDWQGTQPVFLPDGSLVVLFGEDSTTTERIMVVSSADGGRTYSPPRQVAAIRFYHDSTARDLPFPSVATDRQAGVIYATVQAMYGTGTDARPAILFTKSIDKGQTWTDPVPVNDTPAKRSAFTPTIAASADGQHVMIIFYDKRDGPALGSLVNYIVDLYLAESFDGGDNWEPNLRLTEFSSDLHKAASTARGYFFGDYFGLVPAVDFETPAVALWMDARAGNADPYSVQIKRTRGTIFETWRKLRFAATNLADLTLSGDLADPDGDGLVNFSEYALGLDPRVANPNWRPIPSLRTVNGQNYLALTCRQLLAAQDVDYIIEASSDLVHWNATTAQLGEPVLNGDGTANMTFADTLPVSAGAQRFMRVKIVTK